MSPLTQRGVEELRKSYPTSHAVLSFIATAVFAVGLVYAVPYAIIFLQPFLGLE